MIFTLRDNGGPTPTIALMCGSPAIDSGATLRGEQDKDQRGLARIFDDPTVPNLGGGIGQDIGAFESRITRGDSGCNRPPLVTSLTANIGRYSLNSFTLEATAGVADPDGDAIRYQFNLYGEGSSRRSPTIEEFLPNLSEFEFTIFPIVSLTENFTKVGVIAIDSRGNRSPEFIADFSLADPGGPTISAVSYSGGRLKIKGRGLSGQMTVEINGAVIAVLENRSNKKLQIRGTADQLRLGTIVNRIRVRNGTLRSNMFLLNLPNLLDEETEPPAATPDN